MTKAQLFLDVDLAYADVPVPGKIFVPIEAGKFGPISYKSHNTDPLAVEKLIKDLLNRFLLKRLSEVIGADLDAPLEKAKGQINQPIRFQLEIGRGTAAYEFNPNLESFEPDLKISQDGIHLRFDVTFGSELSLAQPKAVLSRRATRGAVFKGKRKKARRL